MSLKARLIQWGAGASLLAGAAVAAPVAEAHGIVTYHHYAPPPVVVYFPSQYHHPRHYQRHWKPRYGYYHPKHYRGPVRHHYQPYKHYHHYPHRPAGAGVSFYWRW